MKTISIPGYMCNGVMIQFHPHDGAPGFTHRVVINGIPKDWLGDHKRPSAAMAAFYAVKHGSK